MSYDETAWHPTTTEYYADPAIGSSALKLFMESRLAFYHRYIAKDTPEEEPSDVMHVGAYVDALLTDPGRLSEYEEHDGKVRSAKAKAKATERGVTLLLPHQVATARDIAAAVRSNDLASALLGGEKQLCHRWKDTSGVTCRLRVDSLKKLADGRVLNVDLKLWTSVSPELLPSGAPRSLRKIETRAWGTGAHHQAALYERGLADAGYPEVEWIWVVAPQQAPYEEIVVLQASEDLKWTGRKEVNEALTQLGALLCHPEKDSREIWTPTYTNEILTLGRPAWARKE